MTPAGFIAVIVTGAAWSAVALADRRARKRRQHINQMAAGRHQAPAPGPLPRRRKTAYAPAGPLTPGEADQFAALVFAYRYVTIPEPAERSGQ